jgi:cytochrome c-type biogenesis protein CcmH/NrfG
MSHRLGIKPENSCGSRNERSNHIFPSTPARRWALLALAVLIVAGLSIIATQALPQIESSQNSTTQQQAVAPVPGPQAPSTAQRTLNSFLTKLVATLRDLLSVGFSLMTNPRSIQLPN